MNLLMLPSSLQRGLVVAETDDVSEHDFSTTYSHARTTDPRRPGATLGTIDAILKQVYAKAMADMSATITHRLFGPRK